jgi:hypothetical protein
MADQDKPSRASNMEKAEGDRRSDAEHGVGNNEGAGISNRSADEEMENQESVPGRGGRKPGAHAG